MNKLIATAIALSLAGCASAPRPQITIMPHRDPVVSPAPVVAPAPVAAGKPLTFKERFRATFKRHPIKLVH